MVQAVAVEKLRERSHAMMKVRKNIDTTPSWCPLALDVIVVGYGIKSDILNVVISK